MQLTVHLIVDRNLTLILFNLFEKLRLLFNTFSEQLILLCLFQIITVTDINGCLKKRAQTLSVPLWFS